MVDARRECIQRKQTAMYLHDTLFMMLWVVTLRYRPTRPCQHQVHAGKGATRHFFFSVGMHIELAAFSLSTPSSMCSTWYLQTTWQWHSDIVPTAVEFHSVYTEQKFGVNTPVLPNSLRSIIWWRIIRFQVVVVYYPYTWVFRTLAEVPTHFWL